MSAQLPPPQPGPGGMWYPVIGPDGAPGWRWVPDPSASPALEPADRPPPPAAAQPAPPPGAAAPPPPPQPEPVPAPPVPQPEEAPSGARLRKLYVSGAIVLVLAAWGAMFALDRTSGGEQPIVAATPTPTPSPTREPATPAERALADVPDVIVDDKEDGTLVVTLGVPAGSGEERAAEVARDTYEVLEALADGDVEFEILLVRGTTLPAEGGPPVPAAPEVYKASFTSTAVSEIDFSSVDRASLDGLRERSVNDNLQLEDAEA